MAKPNQTLQLLHVFWEGSSLSFCTFSPHPPPHHVQKKNKNHLPPLIRPAHPSAAHRPHKTPRPLAAGATAPASARPLGTPASASAAAVRRQTRSKKAGTLYQAENVFGNFLKLMLGSFNDNGVLDYKNLLNKLTWPRLPFEQTPQSNNYKFTHLT